MNPWGSSSKRRDKLYIIAEILEVARKGILKTQVMYRVNLSFWQLNEYLGFISDCGLVAASENSDKVVYKTTSKGLVFLQRYREICELVNRKASGSDNKNHLQAPHLSNRN